MGIRDELLTFLVNQIQLRYTKVNQEESFDYDTNKEEVIQELKYHIGDNTFSPIFLDQLIHLHALGYVKIGDFYHSYELTPIYWLLTKIVNKEIAFKPFNHKDSKLANKGIFHVHHSKHQYLEDNHIRFIKKTFPSDDSIISHLEALKRKKPQCDPKKELIIESFYQSLDWPYKTCEWILFTNKNGKFHFLCLALHPSEDSNDDILYDEIKDHIDF